MRIQIIILVLITNLAFGQEKVSIDKNIAKYEVKDEFNRFDDIANDLKKYKSFDIEVDNNSNITIINKYSTGFTGHTITITIDKKLNIVKVTYEYWTDIMEIDRPIYKVEKIDFKLNQNPFEKRIGLCGQYEMQVKKVSSDGKLLEQTKFKGKFKSFKGIDKSSPVYLWALEQNKEYYGITNENGVYLRPDKMPSLKSDHQELAEKIKKVEGFKPNIMRAFVIINPNGKIERESFKFYGEFELFNKEIKEKVKDLIIELTEWYPACVNEKEVKSQVPIVIGIE